VHARVELGLLLAAEHAAVVELVERNLVPRAAGGSVEVVEVGARRAGRVGRASSWSRAASCSPPSKTPLPAVEVVERRPMLARVELGLVLATQHDGVASR
jgi:hypothetical protein